MCFFVIVAFGSFFGLYLLLIFFNSTSSSSSSIISSFLQIFALFIVSFQDIFVWIPFFYLHIALNRTLGKLLQSSNYLNGHVYHELRYLALLSEQIHLLLSFPLLSYFAGNTIDYVHSFSTLLLAFRIEQISVTFMFAITFSTVITLSGICLARKNQHLFHKITRKLVKNSQYPHQSIRCFQMSKIYAPCFEPHLFQLIPVNFVFLFQTVLIIVSYCVLIVQTDQHDLCKFCN